LHSVKAISVSHAAPPLSRVEVHKELGGDTARTADPNDQRDNPILQPYYVMLSNKAGGTKEGSTFRIMAFVFPGNDHAR